MQPTTRAGHPIPAVKARDLSNRLGSLQRADLAHIFVPKRRSFSGDAFDSAQAASSAALTAAMASSALVASGPPACAMSARPPPPCPPSAAEALRTRSTALK